MSNEPKPVPSNLFPKLYYDDAPAAIEWLARAFGFKKRLVVPGPNGSIVHAEMSFGVGVIMLGSSRPEQKCGSPRRLGGATHVLCIAVDDPDAHFARAKAAKAEIVQELKSESNGGRGYIARDPEGNTWSFSTYIPGTYWTE